MAIKRTILGAEYSEEEIKKYKEGRQTPLRKRIIAEWDRLVEEEKSEIAAFNKLRGTSEINSLWVDKLGQEHLGSEGIPKTLEQIKEITVSDYVNTFWRQFWVYSNKARNAINAKDQLMTVVAKIIYASSKIGVKQNRQFKTNNLTGETAKYWPHGDDSIAESIKGVASAYKSQSAVLLLKGEGNFGAANGDPGAAARYTSISGTPLLTHIHHDLPYVRMTEDEDGVNQPEYIPTPLPIGLINGSDSMGTGRSNFINERKASDVIDWIDYLRNHQWVSYPKGSRKHIGQVPEAMSSTGCDVIFNEENGYNYYYAKVHYRVDRDDITKKGDWDVITNLPPKTTTDLVISKIKKSVSQRVGDKIVDGSGKGKPTWIAVPSGYINRNRDKWRTLNLQYARKEYVLMWDDNRNTMVHTTLERVAKEWFNTREIVVRRRIVREISMLELANHRIDLIKVYADNSMNTWKSEDIVKYYQDLAKEQKFETFEVRDALESDGIDWETGQPVEVSSYEYQGKTDANIVLNTSAKQFLPENIEANKIQRELNEDKIKELHMILKDIGSEIIREAKEVIEENEKFFERGY